MNSSRTHFMQLNFGRQNLKIKLFELYKTNLNNLITQASWSHFLEATDTQFNMFQGHESKVTKTGS